MYQGMPRLYTNLGYCYLALRPARRDIYLGISRSRVYHAPSRASAQSQAQQHLILDCPQPVTGPEEIRSQFKQTASWTPTSLNIWLPTLRKVSFGPTLPSGVRSLIARVVVSTSLSRRQIKHGCAFKYLSLSVG